MDFLDPRKKKSHRNRLIIGYCLVAIVIALATLILVYAAEGFGINTKTGEIIQNGLLFVDSHPGGAQILLNGQTQGSTTGARLVVPSGSYKLEIKKSGYRQWSRDIQLNEQKVARFTYPFLFPTSPVVVPLKTYDAQPPLITESPDRHWLLVESPDSAVSFDQYDTGNLTLPAQALTLPASLLTAADQPGSKFTDLEWASDNTHWLLRHDYQGGNEFIIFDRSNPSASVNLNKLFNINPSQVSLRNSKADQLYIYDQAAGTLQIGDVGKAALEPVLLNHVLDYKTYGSSIVLYVTDSQAPTGQVVVRIRDGNRTYSLTNLPRADKYAIATSQFQGHSYYAVGNVAGDRVNLYKDPVASLSDPSIAKATPFISLNTAADNKLSFSDNSRFIGVEAGQKFAVYDLEVPNRYQFDLPNGLDAPMQWLDGHRWIGSSGGQILVMDYDSTNLQALGATSTNLGALFSRDSNNLLTTAPVAGSNSVTLERIDMRAGSDLPKQP